jgi:Bacterial regulatory proteins, lacI family
MSSLRRATIADMAAASGVGVGTIPRVINGAANLREATRVSVPRVIDQLGYRPSHLTALIRRHRADDVIVVSLRLSREQLSFQRAALLREERVSPLRKQLALAVVHRSSTASFRVTGPPTASAATRPRRGGGRIAGSAACGGRPARRRPGKGNVTRRPARRCVDALAGSWRWLEG